VASVALVAAVAAGGGCGSSGDESTATTASSTSTTTTSDLDGTYLQPPVTPEDVEPQPDGETATFTVTSGTTWHGDLEGDTELTMDGVLDLTTNASSGTIDETFTGTVAGIGRGHLHLSETFTIDPTGAIEIDATVLDGDGDLSDVAGTMHFVGTGDPVTGEGGGTYTASFTR
jgi:hypothetical protein